MNLFGKNKGPVFGARGGYNSECQYCQSFDSTKGGYRQGKCTRVGSPYYNQIVSADNPKCAGFVKETS